jgi:aryl-alcohol dehydrogenase-like predicted oxidoreductase
MRKRILGKDHLEVSSIGLGCWGMSHAYGKADEKESLATIHQCLDQGINFLDTADVYGGGHNERLIAKALKHRRSQVIVATKFGFTGDEHGNVSVNGRPDYVRSACEQSLVRLGIETIDLYYFHRLDPEVPIEDTVGAMADLVCQGKIRYLGLSEVSEVTLGRACAVHPITALQSEYSVWHRDVEKTILPVCKELGVSLVPFSPLGRGFLTGTIAGSRDLAADDYRRQVPRFSPEAMKRNQFLMGMLQHLAVKNGISCSQLSLAWLLAQDDTIVPIPGMKQRKYIDENIKAVTLSLPGNLIRTINNMDMDVCGERHNPYNLSFVDTTMPGK